MRTYKYSICILLFICLAIRNGNSLERSDRKFLAQTFPIDQLKEIIISREEWKPFPSISNPAALEEIPEIIRKAHLQDGEKALATVWTPLPATVFLEYDRIGNRSNYENLSFNRRGKLASLVLAELFERKGRFIDQIVNGVWAICEESFWGVPAHIGAQKAGRGLPDVSEPVVDLFAAETGAMMAWIYYLLKPELDKINPLITQRIQLETDRRILTPYLEREDWGWMGFNYRKRTGYMRPVNNWNPWINSNVLACVLILEQNPERRLKIIHKVMDSIDIFMEPYPADGGCDEGPSYWYRAGGSLYDCQELLYSASGGKINFFDLPLIQEIGKYIYRTYISDPYFINFADASAKMRVEPALVYRYGKGIGDETMKQFAAFTAKIEGYGTTSIPGAFGYLNRQLPALFCYNELAQTTPKEPLIPDVWLPDIQLMAARSEKNSKKGFYLAVKGGHNDESHNHNDVGNFIVYADGKPILIDAGAQTYTAKTFSSERYQIWNNQSAYHNLPTINGVNQKEGRNFEATDIKYQSDSNFAQLQMNIARAYPAEAKLNSWMRTITLNRGTNVEVTENYELNKWTKPIEMNYMTPLNPELIKDGTIKLSQSQGPSESDYYLIYDGKRLKPKIESISITDSRMSRSWGIKLNRIILTLPEKKLKDTFIIKIEN
jgi:hypothetical protein